jgi:YggT family protein
MPATSHGYWYTPGWRGEGKKVMLIQAIQTLSNIIILVVLIDIVLSYFMDPLHPVRRTLDGIVEPMLSPIRRLIPPVGGFDFSPVVLVVLIKLVERILVQLLLFLF